MKVYECFINALKQKILDDFKELVQIKILLGDYPSRLV